MAWGVPVGLGAVLAGQIWHAARRHEPLVVPDYTVDTLIDVTGVGGPPVRLVAVGDSAVAGVGAHSLEGSLPYHVARGVSAMAARPVHVRGLGLSGARVGDVLAEQVPRVPVDTDVALVVAGTNDVTHLTPPARFHAIFVQLLHQLVGSTRFGVVVCSLPDIQSATLLAQPLRSLAAGYAAVLDVVQRQAVSAVPRARFVDARGATRDAFRSDPSTMSTDGFHPSAYGYQLLGEAMVPSVVEVLDGQLNFVFGRDRSSPSTSRSTRSL